MSATSIVPFPSVLHLQQLIEAQQCTSYYDARSTPSEKKYPRQLEEKMKTMALLFLLCMARFRRAFED